MTEKTLLIFDCDGTLVNTEYLSSFGYAAALHKISDKLKHYDAEKIEIDFKGMKISKSAQYLIETYNLDVSVEEITAAYMQEIILHRKEHQKIIPGVKESLEALAKDGRFDMCVASNGEYNNIIASLMHADLMQFFSEDRIFNASMVAEPKPSPLLFLHAAQKCGYEGKDCIVVEDTPLGTTAGKAAGFKVYAFTGCVMDSHKKSEELALKKVGADYIFDKFSQISGDIIAEKTKSYLMSA